MQGRAIKFTGTFLSDLDIAGGQLPRIFKGAQCKGRRSWGLGTGATPTPPSHPSCPACRHSILSRTTFPPAQSPATSAELQEKQSPGQVVSPHPAPKVPLQGLCHPQKRLGRGWVAQSPSPDSYRPSSGSHTHCTARTLSWAHRRCASAPGVGQQQVSGDLVSPKPRSPGDQA